MTVAEQKAAAKKFAEHWKCRGSEKSETHKFWLSLLRDVYGVAEVDDYIHFENEVLLEHMKYMDAYIPSTKVLIEQKSLGKDLNKKIRQSDGKYLTPIEQAEEYLKKIPASRYPRWIITCNFAEFLVYDREYPNAEPIQILLENLPKEYHRLEFLVDTKAEKTINEVEISKAAGDIVADLYDALEEQFKDPESDEAKHSLNVLCVRLVFCFYAEDSGIMAGNNSFGKFLDKHRSDPSLVRKMMLEAFRMFDTPYEERDEYDDKALLDLPYVNGGLFDRNLKTSVPPFNEKIVELIIDKASFAFDWSTINPTIFGALFESTLASKMRHAGGMHYTSLENIHKVIDPLFLDELKAEFEEIKAAKQVNVRKAKLEEFRDKLSGLKFLDPACGSGNFLTETYLSLRRLENEALKILYGDQVVLDDKDVIKVSIEQFYGIEINDFACRVAQTALWIAESQMMRETEEIVHTILEFLPLTTHATIVEENALSLDWESVVPKNELNYIMGNPPFVGSSVMSQGSEQKNDVQRVFCHLDKNEVQDLDYVTCWYKLSVDYIKDTEIEVCFVSTSSIAQGSQVPILWKALSSQNTIYINFAYQTFKWDSESHNKAAVHCVIISFSLKERNKKSIYLSDVTKEVKAINPYLIEGKTIFVSARKEPICNVPGICFGNQPRDGGFLILTDEEKANVLKDEPQLAKWIRLYVGATEFINNKTRWCLWLKEASPKDIKSSKILHKRVDDVREFRLSSKAKTTNGYAKVPHLFAQITQTECERYIIVPNHSSEKRRYIPIGFEKGDVISSNAVQIIPDANIFHFGILTSIIHMAWTRVICGRIKSDYRYSKEIVYNNFPWCNPTDEQKAKIEATAQAILDARAKYPDCSLADLYDENTMPIELRKAHKANDQAVLAAYGFPKDIAESEIVAELMKMYQELTRK